MRMTSKKTSLVDTPRLTSTAVSNFPHEMLSVYENRCQNGHSLYPATNHLTDLSINLNFLQHNENLNFKLEKCDDCNILKAKKTTLDSHEPKTSIAKSMDARDKTPKSSYETPVKKPRASLKRSLALSEKQEVEVRNHSEETEIKKKPRSESIIKNVSPNKNPVYQNEIYHQLNKDVDQHQVNFESDQITDSFQSSNDTFLNDNQNSIEKSKAHRLSQDFSKNSKDAKALSNVNASRISIHEISNSYQNPRFQGECNVQSNKSIGKSMINSVLNESIGVNQKSIQQQADSYLDLNINTSKSSLNKPDVIDLVDDNPAPSRTSSSCVQESLKNTTIKNSINQKVEHLAFVLTPELCPCCFQSTNDSPVEVMNMKDLVGACSIEPINSSKYASRFIYTE